MRLLKPLTSLTAILAAMLMLITTMAAPADAHDGKYATNAVSGNDSGSSTSHNYQWSTNGCTAVPDQVNGVFYFNHACDHHDGCYSGHWESRSGCDGRFYWNMEASCKYNFSWWNPSRTLCRGVRTTYYLGVRAFGAPAYYNWSISSILG